MLEYRIQKEKILLNSVSVNSANFEKTVSENKNFIIGKTIPEIFEDNTIIIKKKMREEIINNLNEAEREHGNKKEEMIKIRLFEAENKLKKLKNMEEIGNKEMTRKISLEIKEEKTKLEEIKKIINNEIEIYCFEK